MIVRYFKLLPLTMAFLWCFPTSGISATKQNKIKCYESSVLFFGNTGPPMEPQSQSLPLRPLWSGRETRINMLGCSKWDQRNTSPVRECKGTATSAQCGTLQLPLQHGAACPQPAPELSSALLTPTSFWFSALQCVIWHCEFNLHFSNDQWRWALSMCVRAICISSSVTCLLKFLDYCLTSS